VCLARWCTDKGKRSLQPPNYSPWRQPLRGHHRPPGLRAGRQPQRLQAPPPRSWLPSLGPPRSRHQRRSHSLLRRSVRERDALALPFGTGRTSPIAPDDVARVVAALLLNPPKPGQTFLPATYGPLGWPPASSTCSSTRGLFGGPTALCRGVRLSADSGHRDDRWSAANSVPTRRDNQQVGLAAQCPRSAPEPPCRSTNCRAARKIRWPPRSHPRREIHRECWHRTFRCLDILPRASAVMPGRQGIGVTRCEGLVGRPCESSC